MLTAKASTVIVAVTVGCCRRICVVHGCEQVNDRLTKTVAEVNDRLTRTVEQLSAEASATGSAGGAGGAAESGQSGSTSKRGMFSKRKG